MRSEIQKMSQQIDKITVFRAQAEQLNHMLRTGKVFAPCEVTNVPNISAIGDVVEDRPELTPVAKVTAGHHTGIQGRPVPGYRAQKSRL